MIDRRVCVLSDVFGKPSRGHARFTEIPLENRFGVIRRILNESSRCFVATRRFGRIYREEQWINGEAGIEASRLANFMRQFDESRGRAIRQLSGHARVKGGAKTSF